MTSSKDTAAAAAAGSGADAAGGEAIYSSDGLPPLPAPVPPIKSRQEADDDDAILDSESMSPTDAFEVFGGRAYLRPAGGSRRSNGAAVAAAGNLVAGSAAGGGTGLAVEPPLVRLARLSAELTELERDLAATSATTAGDGAGAAGSSAPGVSNEELTKLVRELSSRLEVMSNQHGIAPGAGGAGKTLSDNLTRLVREELTKMEQTSAAAASADDGTASASGIVYELYASSSTGHVGPTSAASAASEASIEERLGRIERAVGSTAGGTSASQSSLAAAVAAGAPGGGVGSGRTVLERLEEAEKMAGRVDAKALDAAAARAKVIR